MGKLDGKVAVITGATSGMALDDSSYVNGMELVADGGATVI
jgi:NADP-dependent 3-hydroxy acid dehydrogenase YdfG